MKLILKNNWLWCFVLVIFSANLIGANGQGVCLPYSLKYKGPDARRVWLASTLPADIEQQVVNIQEELKKLGLRGGSFEKPDRLHVTLRGLGSINSQPMTEEAVAKALEKVPIRPVDLKIAKIGILTNSKGGARLIWALINSSAMENMYADIDGSIRGFCDRERLAYKPHITLYRFQNPRSTRPLPRALADKINNLKVDIPKFEVEGFKLLETPKDKSKPYPVLHHYKHDFAWEKSGLFQEPGSTTPQEAAKP